MRILSYTIPIQYDGRMVKEYLRQEMKCSGTLIKALKRQNRGILLNGEPVYTVDRLHAGDRLELQIPQAEGYCHHSVEMPLSVVLQDDDILVLDKPPFMAVHHSANHHKDTLANGVAYYLQQQGLSAAFRAVNRLDRDTSGLVLLGLNPYAAARLAQGIEKVYYAVVDGVYRGKGTIDLPIRRKGGSVILREVGEGGQQAVTHWESIAVYDRLSLLKIHLGTGRTHQIRVHFSHFGTPVLGDTLYSKGDSRIHRQALHCGEMRFHHPVTGELVACQAPLPADIKGLLE